jgi:hypothetical protein
MYGFGWFMTGRPPLRAHSRLVSSIFGVIGLVGAQMLASAEGSGAAYAGSAAPAQEAAERDVAVPRSIVELQPYRQTNSNNIDTPQGSLGTVKLINLNPTINAWYLLKILWKDGSVASYHLENPQPHAQSLTLDPNDPASVELSEGDGRRPCKLFADEVNNPLIQASKSHVPYAPLCEGRLFLRNPVKGHLTRLEAEAEFVRNQVWGGEKVTVIMHHLLEDTHRQTAELSSAADQGAGIAGVAASEGAPLAALVDSRYADHVLTPSGLGLPLEVVHGPVRPGTWYAASGNPGVYVSVIEPQFIDTAILESHKTTVNALDSVEASSLCYLVAFDLDHFDLGYALGTEHPSVEWSEHIQPQMRDPTLPGPDGIGTITPLVSTGVVSPQSATITVATFAGGFKRMHGAFKYGRLATLNHGSHYGFVENGVVFSKLQPGLATVFVLEDGSVQMKTWGPQDDRLLAKVRYARQSGVPLVEFDDRSQSTTPGQLVNQWGAGNWSGSEDMKLRTLRAGAALQANGKKAFLIYAVFSDATPSAMARVFQAYRCRYGMHLDMNALEHSYFALYRRSGSQLFVDYLIDGMSEVDETASGGKVPRFLGYSDNRDFFFITRRSQ